jgi:solute carrier family 35 protein F5
VLASLFGIILISTSDLSGGAADNRGTFPEKTPSQVALGDALAFLSAILYGFYAILMKKRIGDEARVDLPLFFGLVGLFNLAILWPGFFLLHFFGDEPFELPPTARVWTIVMVNSATSLLSDFCWAYAMLLTSPLLVTVGLSLTIPLSLVGEMILRREFEGWVYWVGAGVVFLGFVIVSWEGKHDDEGDSTGNEQQEARS